MDESVSRIQSLLNEIIRMISKGKEEIEKELSVMLEKSKDMFDIITEYEENFIKDELRPMDFYYHALDRLTGVYMYISPIVQTMKSLIERQSLKHYHARKMEFESRGDKFTSAPIERESDFVVSEMKIYFSIFEGFLDSCKQGIQTCRVRIREVEEEKDLAK